MMGYKSYADYIRENEQKDWSKCIHIMPPEAHPPTDNFPQFTDSKVKYRTKTKSQIKKLNKYIKEAEQRAASSRYYIRPGVLREIQ